MRNIWMRLLLVAVVWAGAGYAPSTTAQETAPPPEVTALNDYAQEAEKLKSRALAAVTEFEALKAQDQALQNMTLAELLASSTPIGALKRFAAQNELLLKLGEYIDDPDAWYLAAIKLESRGNHADTLYAAWYAYDKSTSLRPQVAALDKMADAHISLFEVATALEVLEFALKLDPAPHRKRRLAGVRARFELRVIDVTVDVEAHTPTACLVFSKPLKSPLPIEGADYLRFEKPMDVAVRARSKSLCIEGLDYGTKVPVTILAGVPGENGGALYGDLHRTIEVPDRAARISMGNGTYILPRTGGEMVPLKTVNLKSADLKLFSVPDRGLVPFLKSGLNGAHLNHYSERQMSDEFGSLVWEGSVDIEAAKNKETTTLVPINDMIDRHKPGLYALVARQPGADEAKRRRWLPHITQWLLVSDLGLMTLSGADGLHVYVNSLESAKPVRKVKLRLIAHNNSVLAEVESGRGGIGSFAKALMRGKGGDRPAAIVAETAKGDYAFLKLTGPALDLSERGASGRADSGPLDAFLFTERGIYRPGEPVFVGALLRDAKAKAVGKLQLTFQVRRPDGLEAFKETLTGDELGGYQFNYGLSASARTGHWRITVYADNEKEIIGETRFQVDDFVPQRLATKLTVTGNKLLPGSALEANIQADFLYGAPGAGLKGDLYLKLEPDPLPFESYKRYKIGLAQDEFKQQQLDKESFITGADGLARIDIMAETFPDTSKPLLARLNAQVRDVGGRPVSDTLLVPVRNKTLYLGIKARATGAFAETQAAEFDAIALDRNGEAVAGHEITVVWVREHYNYSWYNQRGRWQYRSDVYDEVIGETTAQTEEDGSVPLLRALSPGRYRVELYDEEADAATSLRFNVGWWTHGQSPDVPDALELTLQDNQAVSGGRVKGFIRAPFAGTAMITVVNNQVLSHKAISLKKDGSAFEIKVGKDWGPSAYVLATALRPDAGAISRLPVRATGLAWFSIDQKQRVHRLTLDVPETALPGSKVAIPVKLEGGSSSGMHKLMIAAVDEGILNITRFKSPNPAKHYFGKRNFAVDIRDIYGRLIRSEDGSRGTLRTGGDLMFDEIMVSASKRVGDKDNLASPVTRTTRTIALFERDVQLNADGEGTLSLDIPDFTGRLRLMAVAYGANSVGQGRGQLTVRTPVVADFVMPRFLAPGDTAQAVLSLQNLSGKETTVTVAFSKNNNFITLTGPVEAITLKDGERRDVPVLLSGTAPGDTKINLSVKGEDMQPIDRNWSITVRAAWPYTTKRLVTPVAAGTAGVVPAGALADFLPQSISQRLTVSSRPNLEAARHITDLRYYAYWCSEQTVSKAYPSLLYDKLARQYDLPISRDTASNTVEGAIARLVDRQKSNGGFGVWSWSGGSNPWLDIYVTDFLFRAKEAAYHVSDATLELALSNIKRHAANRRKDTEFYVAYAQYLLARLGEVSASQVRYFADHSGAKIKNPLAKAQLGAALYFVGERSEGARYFDKAVRSSRGKHNVYDYGSGLRDSAAIAALIAEVLPDAEHMAALAEALERDIGKKKWLNTQEMSWLTRAAAAFSGDSDESMSFILNSKLLTGEKGMWSATLSGKQASADITLENTSDVAVRAIRSIRGITAAAPVAEREGMAVSRIYYDMDGNPADVSVVKQNTRLVVILEAEVSASAARNPLIVDLLPAGLEIESTDTSGIDFVGTLTPAEFIDARDDRLVAAYDWNRRYIRNRKIRVAYIVRAITPGDYILPGTYAEDMYLPRFRAQGPANRIVVEQ